MELRGWFFKRNFYKLEPIKCKRPNWGLIESTYQLKPKEATHSIRLCLAVLGKRELSSVSSSISYRNRFIKYKRNYIDQLSGLIDSKGFQLRFKKKFDFIFLNFIRLFMGLNVQAGLVELFSFHEYDTSDFFKLFITYEYIKDLRRSLPLFLKDLAPIIKSVSTVFKQKKVKKKEKSPRKYKISYRYVKPQMRMQTLLRWLSLLVKVGDRSISKSFSRLLPSIFFDPENSKVSMVRSKVYSGLLAST